MITKLKFTASGLNGIKNHDTYTMIGYFRRECNRFITCRDCGHWACYPCAKHYHSAMLQLTQPNALFGMQQPQITDSNKTKRKVLIKIVFFLLHLFLLNIYSSKYWSKIN